VAWLQLRVHTAHPEFAEELLLANGASAVTMVDAGDNPVLEPAPGATPLWQDTVTVGLFNDGTDLAPIVAALQEHLPEGAQLVTASELVEDREWIRVWLKDCPPMQFGDRLWVVPIERANEVADASAIVVKLDPGLAFGTGTHPSTALCLEWLASQSFEGAKVVDYGCGSGILAIAALKLGAERAVGSDIDPQALTATKQNAEVNGVAGRISGVTAEDFVPFPADVVVANILANPLIALAPILSSSLRRGGLIALAGLLESQAPEVRAAYDKWIAFDTPRLKDGWALLHGTCRAPAVINDLAITPKLRTAGQPQVEHFDAFARDGITAVINLAMPSSPNWIADEAGLARAAGMEYTHIPVQWESPADDDLQKFFARMEELRDRRVLVHCAMNKRVSAFVFLWRVVVEKIAPEIAARDLLRIWHPNEGWRSFIDKTLAQHQVKLSLKTFSAQ
jgi:ribosomal protein L11 methyltransferase